MTRHGEKSKVPIEQTSLTNFLQVSSSLLTSCRNNSSAVRQCVAKRPFHYIASVRYNSAICVFLMITYLVRSEVLLPCKRSVIGALCQPSHSANFRGEIGYSFTVIALLQFLIEVVKCYYTYSPLGLHQIFNQAPASLNSLQGASVCLISVFLHWCSQLASLQRVTIHGENFQGIPHRKGVLDQ